MTHTLKLRRATFVVTVGPSNDYNRLAGSITSGRLTAFFLTRYLTVVRIAK